MALNSDCSGSDSTVFLVEHGQRGHADIHQHLAGVLEVHRHPVAHDGLDLADAPVRPSGMADALAGLVFGAGPHGSGERAPGARGPEAFDAATPDPDIPVEPVDRRVAMAG